MTTTKTEKLLNAFSRGQELTSEQIANKFGLVNVSATIHRLREEGNPIYLNSRKNKNGEKVRKYRLGTPNRSGVYA